METARRYWDSVAERIDSPLLIEEIADYKKKEHISLMEGWVNGSNKKVVLKTDLFEEALGNDSFMDYLIENYRKIYGVDISEKIVEKAKANHEKIRSCLFTEDIRNTHFKNETFDVVLSCSTLDHMPKSELIKALKEINRILKNGGCLILTLDNKHNRWYHISYELQKLTGLIPFRLGDCYSVEEIKRCADETGFTIDKVTSIVPLVHGINLFGKMLYKLHPKAAKKIINKNIVNAKRNPASLSSGWFLAFRMVKNER